MERYFRLIKNDYKKNAIANCCHGVLIKAGIISDCRSSCSDRYASADRSAACSGRFCFGCSACCYTDRSLFSPRFHSIIFNVGVKNIQGEKYVFTRRI